MEIIGFSLDTLLTLFIVAIVAGFIDTLAGGGGLIALPALMLSGISPIAALATNKLQGAIGTATSSYLMVKKKRIVWSEIKAPMLYAFIGSLIGTIIIHFINIDALEFIVAVVLLIIGLYFLFLPKLQRVNQKIWSKVKYQRIAVPLVGFYDGMFGPGAGSFFNLTGIAMQGFDIIKSTATAKTLNFASNVASLCIYLFSGHIVWVLGLVMTAGQIIGASLGSIFLLTIKPTYLRYLVVFMSSIMLLKYAHQNNWFMG